MLEFIGLVVIIFVAIKVWDMLHEDDIDIVITIDGKIVFDYHNHTTYEKDNKKDKEENN